MKVAAARDATAARKAPIPRPSTSDVLDAFDHAGDVAGRELKPGDFRWKYLGKLNIEQLSAYDDFGSWLDIDPKEAAAMTPWERIHELEHFRGIPWATRASAWGARGIPPIVIVSVPDEDGRVATMIADGRGRTNFVALTGKSVHAWHAIHRSIRGWK